MGTLTAKTPKKRKPIPSHASQASAMAGLTFEEACRLPTSEVSYIGPVGPGWTISAVEHRPGYPPAGFSTLGCVPKPGELYGANTDGHCMWPNLWSGDFIVCRGIEPLKIDAGRHLRKQPLAGAELAAWMLLQDKIVHVEFNGKSMVKRLHILEQIAPGGQIHLICDNAHMFHSLFRNTGESLTVLGVVEMSIPFNRDPATLPAEMAGEYERVYYASLRAGAETVEEKLSRLLYALGRMRVDVADCRRHQYVKGSTLEMFRRRIEYLERAINIVRTTGQTYTGLPSISKIRAEVRREFAKLKTARAKYPKHVIFYWAPDGYRVLSRRDRLIVGRDFVAADGCIDQIRRVMAAGHGVAFIEPQSAVESVGFVCGDATGTVTA